MSRKIPMMFAALLALAGAAPQGGQTIVTPATIQKLTAELATKYGESERSRIERGLNQAARFWRKEDGNEADFAEVAREQVAGDSAVKNALFSRMEFGLESLDGHMNEIARDFRRQSDLDIGEIYPFDEILAGYDPAAHVNDDFFANRLAFAVLLNFPLTTLEQRLTEGDIVVAPPVGRGAARRALRAARAGRREPRDRRGPRRRRAATSPATTSGCTTSWTRRASASSPRSSACSPTGTCATRSRPTTPTRRTASRSQRTIAQVMERIVDADDPEPRRRQPARGLGPVHQRRQDLDGQGLRRGHAARHEGLQRARARHALRHAARDLRGRAQGRSVLADARRRSSPAASTTTAQIPEARCARCSRPSSPRRSCRRSRR